MRALVIGAGAVGLACALRLAERGASVLVLEAEPHGAAPTRTASRAAAGMLAPLSESFVEPPHVHPRLFDLGMASLALWRDLGPRLALSTFPPRGALWRAPRDRLDAFEARARDRGLRAERRSESELHLPEEGALEPLEALAALERALNANGGSVRRSAAVAEIGVQEALLVGGGREKADIVVLATGLGAPDIASDASPLTPAKGQMVELRSDALAPGATLRGEDVYAVGRAGGRVIVGATMEFERRDFTTDAAALARLTARAAALMPELASAPKLNAWAGLRPMSADWAPRIGWRDGVILARGHARNGWLLAPVSAAMVSAAAFGEPRPDLWTEFAP